MKDIDEKIKQLKQFIDESERICVFTGAGISCPSGIPDFRSSDGLYNRESKYRFSPEEIISHSFFVKHTDMFYDFYKSAMLYPNAQPNKAHLYFAQKEKEGKKISVVTQNIDGLHTKAGNTDVTEIHGSVHRNHCTKCGKFFDLDYIVKSKGIPYCSECGGIVKPDVVLYEEPLDENDTYAAVKAVSSAQTLIVIGTSLAVYPAASFLQYFNGEHLALINKTPTPADAMANLVINCDVIEVIERLESE